MSLSVVDKVDGGVGCRAFGGAFIVDDIHGTSMAVADGEVLPFGGYTWVEDEFVATFVNTDDVLDTSLVGPRGRTGVPSPSTTAGMLRVAVDVGGYAVGLNLIFEDIGKGLCAMDGVDEGVEEVGHVVVSFFQLGHDVPHGSVGVLSSVFAHTDRVVHDVAGRRLR